MVFKNILRIKAALPEVIHVAMFYNNGTIFQTTFEQEINIPKLGENLAEILNHIRKLYEISNYNFEDYKKIIFETDDISIIILKLGEDSNIALFFRKEEEIKQLKEELHEKKEKIEKLSIELNSIDKGLIEDDKSRITKALNELELESANLNHEIEKKNEEIGQLKEKIEKSHK